MKIDRMLGVTVYLLNRKKVSARELAVKFEVSKRTIQRDVEVLNAAGIPITATYGANGGYEILDTFKMERQLAGKGDYDLIAAALKSLITADESPKADALLEKVLAVKGREGDAVPIFVDFGVSREGQDTEKLHTLEDAIRTKRAVSFEYTSAAGTTARHEVEPIALAFKWYAWYLFAFSNRKKDYRLYKLVRMTALERTEHPFLQEHQSAERLLEKNEATDDRRCLDIELICRAEVKMLAVEYLNGKIVKEYENGDYLMQLRLPENEQLWFGTLLSLGDKAEVVKPESLREQLRQRAVEILKMYG